MEDLDLEKFGDYRVMRYESNIETIYRLAYYDGDYYYNLEDINRSYYLHGDFSCRIEGATTKMALDFLNNFKDTINKLDDYETKMCKDIEGALKENE